MCPQLRRQDHHHRRRRLRRWALRAWHGHAYTTVMAGPAMSRNSDLTTNHLLKVHFFLQILISENKQIHIKYTLFSKALHTMKLLHRLLSLFLYHLCIFLLDVLDLFLHLTINFFEHIIFVTPQNYWNRFLKITRILQFLRMLKKKILNL